MFQKKLGDHDRAKYTFSEPKQFHLRAAAVGRLPAGEQTNDANPGTINLSLRHNLQRWFNLETFLETKNT